MIACLAWQRIVCLYFLCLLLTGCSLHRHLPWKVKHAFAQEHGKCPRKSIRQLVRHLPNLYGFTGASVSRYGIQPPHYAYVLTLQREATTPELVRLTSHRNAVVRCYAVQLLVERPEADLFPIAMRHLDDNGSVNTYFGCVRDRLQTGTLIIGKIKSHLAPRQRRIIDSIALRSATVGLSYNQVRALAVLPDTLPASYYHFIRRLATRVLIPHLDGYRKQMRRELAITKLAAYRRPRDRSLIRSLQLHYQELDSATVAKAVAQYNTPTLLPTARPNP